MVLGLRSRVLALSVIALLPFASKIALAEADELATLRQHLVDTLCSDDGAWLWCTSFPPAKCPELAFSVIDPCIERARERAQATLLPTSGPEVRQDVVFCTQSTLEARYQSIRRDMATCTHLPVRVR